MSPHRLLLVEDEPWLREDLTKLLDAPGTGLEVAAACASAEEALALGSAGLAFDAALVDVGLPGLSGVELVRALRRARPEVTCVVFTVFDDARTIVDAFKAGARGYLLKSTPLPRLRASLLEAIEGGAPMTPSVARLVVAELASPTPPVAHEDQDSLSPRQRDVLGLLAKGLTYAEIARSLGLALSTVQTHVRAIYEKLEITSKAEAAVFATRTGMT
jgi:DNA-binding NarL/FixJ family response regulator